MSKPRVSMFHDLNLQSESNVLQENIYLANSDNIIQQSDEDEKQQGVFKSQRKISNVKARFSCNHIPTLRQIDAQMDNFEKIIHNNQQWSAQTLRRNPLFFQKLKLGQKPEFLWIGCSDSRVPANEIIGLEAGQLFVHRNIANQAPLSDVNALAVIQFAVQNLKVKDIIVCGHYGCGGIKAAFKKHDYGALQTWLSHIRNLRARFRQQLNSQNPIDNQNLLIELNIKHNVENISRIPIVQKAWKQGQQLRIHGLVYRLQDGILNNLQIIIDSLQQLPEEFRIY